MFSISTDVPELQHQFHNVLIQIIEKNPALVDTLLKDYYEQNKDELKNKVDNEFNRVISENGIKDICDDLIHRRLEDFISESIVDNKIREFLDGLVSDETINERIDDYLESQQDIEKHINDKIDDAIDEADVSSKINDAISEVDISEKIDSEIGHYDFDKEVDEGVKDAIDNSCNIEKKVTETIDTFIDGINPSLNERIDVKVNELISSDILTKLINQRILCLDSIFKEVISGQIKEYCTKNPMLQNVKPAIDSSNKVNIINVEIPSDKYDLIINLLKALKIEYSIPSPNF